MVNLSMPYLSARAATSLAKSAWPRGIDGPSTANNALVPTYCVGAFLTLVVSLIIFLHRGFVAAVGTASALYGKPILVLRVRISELLVTLFTGVLLFAINGFVTPLDFLLVFTVGANSPQF